MEITIAKFILAVVVTHIIHFVLFVLMYMNPVVIKIYISFDQHPSMKRWDAPGKLYVNMFFLSFIEIVLIGIVYISTVQALPNDFWMKGLVFGLIVAGVRVYSKFYSMYIQTSYPSKLLAIEVVNGTIGCIIIGLGFSYFF